MKFDYHTHHDRCGHAQGSIRDYIESAIVKGLDMIGISDHSPYFSSEEDQPYPHIAMGKSQFPEYVKEVLQLKEEYKDKIDVLLGVESDFFPEHVELYRECFDPFPFDYIIGSVHQVEGISIFNKKRWAGLSHQDQVVVKENYYNLIERSARSGMFQILGHIDAMKGYYPAFSSIQSDVVEHTIKVVAENELALEVNTSGKTKYCGGWYPAEEILEMAHYYGARVTFGSDAHTPDRVADDFDLVKQTLLDIGFTEWAYFKEKKMFLQKLE